MIAHVALSPIRVLILSAWCARITSALVGIFSLRILNAELDHNQYAIYIVIIGISGWFTIFGDPGFGFYIQNKISEKIAKDEKYGADILSAYILLGSVAILITMFTYLYKSPISYFLFHRIEAGTDHNLEIIFWFSALVLAVSVAVSASNKFLYAVGRGYIGNIIAALASMVGLLILMYGLKNSENKIIYSIFATCGPPMAFSLALAALQIKKSWENHYLINIKMLINVLVSSKGFFIFSLLGALVVQTDYMIMSQKVDSIDIVQYYNLAKIFGIMVFINQAILYAIWPNFTQKYIKKEHDYIYNNIVKIAVLTSLITIIGTTFIIYFSGYLGLLLSSDPLIEYQKIVILSFGIVAILRCIVDPYSIFLQSINDTKPLIIFLAIQAPICFTLQWVLSTYLSIVGILLGLACSIIFTVLWMLPNEVKNKLSLST
jgi:O-antigen/teichoic acid export membrane protein